MNETNFFRASVEDFESEQWTVVSGETGARLRNSDLSDAPLTFRVFWSGGALAQPRKNRS